LEELFFFVIQTYMTSILYLLLSKATFYPSYLLAESNVSNVSNFGSKARSDRKVMLLGLTLGAGALYLAVSGIRGGGQGTYMGLIVLWAFPFLMLLW
jgi:15-cis-phytoene synthase/lycopene beta-cyclase